jgi:DNA modification methylase
MIEVNKNYNESNLETMAKMPDCFVDLTVTSPPYDGLRTYNGYSFPFEDIAKELYRITKKGGIVVWVVGDKIKNGNKSLTSFRQSLFFQEIGFNVHDVMIYRKKNTPFMRSNAYTNCYEFMFVFSKGKPNTFNPLKTKTVRSGKEKLVANKKADGINKKVEGVLNEEKTLTNIWDYAVGLGGSTSDRIAFEHPAIFPEQLANDHIISWSNENDLIYDPFMGSGTTAKMCILNNRNWIGSEMSSEYCNIIEERIKKAWEEKRKEKDLQAGTLFGNEM